MTLKTKHVCYILQCVLPDRRDDKRHSPNTMVVHRKQKMFFGIHGDNMLQSRKRLCLHVIRSEISKYGQFKYMRNLSVNTATLRKSRRLLSNLKALLQHVLLGTLVKNVSNLMHCLHVLSPRHILSQRGDKSCWKVHSLFVLSLLRQQILHLYYLDVCVCAACARASVGACVLCCVLLSPHQWVFNWNSVLLWVDHKATVACSSVKQCVKTSIGTNCAVWLWVRCT